MSLVWSWLLVPAAAADVECVARLDRSALSERMEEAESAWLELDQTAFRRDVNELAGLIVPCMGDLVPPDLSARWHRLMALRLDDLGDGTDAELAVASARLVDGSLTFDDAWVGADHHLRAAFDGASATGVRRVPVPKVGDVAFDGTLGRERPVDRPTLVQVFDETGTATATRWLGPTDPLPAYAAVPRLRNRLLVGSAASVVTGGVALGLAYQAQSALFEDARDPATTRESLESTRFRADALSVTSGLCFGLAAGFGTSAALVGQR